MAKEKKKQGNRIEEARTSRIDQRVLRLIIQANRVLRNPEASDDSKWKALGKLAALGAISGMVDDTLREHALSFVRQLDA